MAVIRSAQPVEKRLLIPLQQIRTLGSHFGHGIGGAHAGQRLVKRQPAEQDTEQIRLTQYDLRRQLSLAR